MEIGFSYESFSKHISEEVAVRVDYQNDYMLGFDLYDTDHMFLKVGWFEDLKEDEVLVSMGYISDDVLEEMIQELVDKGQYTFMDELEDEVKSVDEFITYYPFQAIEDLINFYGISEFAMGYGEAYHRIKIKDLDNFIKQYLNA